MSIPDDLLEAYGRKQMDEYTHWVYVLSCRSHYRTFSELQRKANARIQREPDWLREAFEARELLYVGQTENLEKRLGQHFKNKMSSDFTTLFEPRGIERLEPQHTRTQAEFQEERLREELHNPRRKVFAYSA